MLEHTYFIAIGKTLYAYWEPDPQKARHHLEQFSLDTLGGTISYDLEAGANYLGQAALPAEGIYDLVVVPRLPGNPTKKSRVLAYLQLLLPLAGTALYSVAKSGWSIPDFRNFDVAAYRLKDQRRLFKLFPQKNQETQRLFPLVESRRKLDILYFLPHRNLTGGLKMLCEQARLLQKRGHRVQLLIQGSHARALPVWVEGFTPDGETVLPADADLLEFLDQNPCDIIFAGWFQQLKPLAAAKVPVFYWEQGHEALYGDHGSLEKEAAIRQNHQDHFAQDIYLATDSEYVRDVVRARFGRDSHVLPVFIDTEAWYPSREASENQFPIILLVGSPLLAFKGFSQALRVLEKAWQQGLRFTVQWACQQAPPQLDVSFPLSFRVNVPQRCLAALYRTANILLSCSDYEGCPMPPLEAMASGTAVVATDSGGILQYARHQENALIAQTNSDEELVSHLRRLLNNPVLRDKLIQNGLATARSMSAQNSAAHLEALLASAVEDHAKKTPPPKKVLFFIGTLLGGGAEKVLVDLVQKLDPAKFDITVMTLLEQGLPHYLAAVGKKARLLHAFRTTAETPAQRQEYQEQNRRLKSLYPDKQAFYEAIITDTYDVEVAFLEDDATPIIAASTNPSSQKIAWVHSDAAHHPPQVGLYQDGAHKQRVYQAFHDVVFVSEGARTGFLQQTPIPGRVHVLPNPLDTRRILELAQEPLPEQLESQGFIIAAAGRLVELKGFQRLLEAFKALDPVARNCRLWLLGDGPLMGEFKQYIKESQLEDRVLLLGFQTNPYPYLAAANLFVCSSHTEGYSTVLSEAALLGTPILTTDCAGTRDLLGESRYGLIVENSLEGLAKGLVKFLDNPAFYQHYAAAITDLKELLLSQNPHLAIEGLLLGESGMKPGAPAAPSSLGLNVQDPIAPLVSVLVPVYQQEKWLLKCLDSISTQSLNNFEVILLDDGSTDGSATLMKDYARKDGRFNYIHQPHSGTMRARARALEESRGEYVLFVDPNDWIEPRTLELLHQQALKEKADVVYYDYYEENPVLGTQLKRHKTTSLCLKLIRSDLLKGVGLERLPTVSHGEDWLISAILETREPRTAYLTEHLYHACWNPQNISRDFKEQNSYDLIACYSFLTQHLIELEIYEAHKKKLFGWRQHLAAWAKNNQAKYPRPCQVLLDFFS